METIEVKVYEFHELSEESKKRAIKDMDTVNHHYDWLDEVDAFNDVLKDVKGEYSENSQGPYWDGYGKGIDRIFTEFCNENRGEIKKTLESQELYSPITKAFVEDMLEFVQDLKYDDWNDSLYHDAKSYFWPQSLLNAISEWHYDTWVWLTSEEYCADFASANGYRFLENGYIA